MELAKQFGIEPTLLVAQIVNFLIILFLLKRFLYKPVMTLLKNRKAEIKEGLDKAEEGRLLLEKAKKEEEELLQKAQARSEKIQDLAKTQASELLKEAREEAKAETERLIQEAKDSIVKETEAVQDKLIVHVTEISVDLLKKTLSQTVSQKAQKEIMSNAVKMLKKRAN